MDLSDREISAGVLEACRQGDRTAFRAIYDRYKDKVYSIALYFFHGDAASASDATQQVFLKLMTDFHHFRGDSAFSTWLYRLVANTCIDSLRLMKRQPVPLEHCAMAGTQSSQQKEVEQDELARSVQMAVSALPPRFRMAILLRYFEDLSYEEMAKALNCSMGTVASRLSRGHRMLAAKLAAFRGTRDV